MLTLNGRLILRANAIHAISSIFLPTLPFGLTPAAPKHKIIDAGIVKLAKLIALLLRAVSVTAVLAAKLELPASF